MNVQIGGQGEMVDQGQEGSKKINIQFTDVGSEMSSTLNFRK
jgi:hypothetical protein